MLHPRAVIPPDRTDEAGKVLADRPGATNMAVLPDAVLSPRGDLVTGDVARESANEVVDALQTARPPDVPSGRVRGRGCERVTPGYDFGRYRNQTYGSSYGT